MCLITLLLRQMSDNSRSAAITAADVGGIGADHELMGASRMEQTVTEKQILEWQVEVAERNLDRQLEWIGRLDGRSSFVFGVDVLLLSLLGGTVATAWQFFWGVAIVALAASLQVASLGLIAACNFPRLKAPNNSLFYFGTIAGRTSTDFAAACRASTRESVHDDLLAQCHRNAEIVARKSTHLRRAYKLLFFSLVPWLAAMALLIAYTQGAM